MNQQKENDNNSIGLEKLKELKSNLDSSFEGLSFQIDLINSEVTLERDVVNYLNNNSTRLQHLLDEEPRLIRWWFNDFESALDAMVKISSVRELSHRLICLDKQALFIQLGNFN